MEQDKIILGTLSVLRDMGKLKSMGQEEAVQLAEFIEKELKK